MLGNKITGESFAEKRLLGNCTRFGNAKHFTACLPARHACFADNWRQSSWKLRFVWRKAAPATYQRQNRFCHPPAERIRAEIPRRKQSKISQWELISAIHSYNVSVVNASQLAIPRSATSTESIAILVLTVYGVSTACWILKIKLQTAKRFYDGENEIRKTFRQPLLLFPSLINFCGGNCFSPRDENVVYTFLDHRFTISRFLHLWLSSHFDLFDIKIH